MNPVFRTKILIAGPTQDEAAKSLDDLKNELAVRTWIVEPKAFWSSADNCLIVDVGYDAVNAEAAEAAALDEIRDCVIATIVTKGDLKFSVRRAV